MPGVWSAFGFQRECMKHIHFILSLVLIAMGVNILMAIVCASLPHAMHPDAGRTATLRKQYWARFDASGNSVPDSLRITGVYSAFGRELRIIRPHLGEPVVIFKHYAGWPLSAFRGIERVVTFLPDDQGPSPETREYHFTIQLQDNLKVYGPTSGTMPSGIRSIVMKPLGLKPHPTQVLPLRPLPGGFIVNTLFYILLIIAGPVLWKLGRGTYYIFKGRCPRCGYDLRHGPPDRAACPECGRVVRPDSVRPV